jgi:hypothetical protein
MFGGAFDLVTSKPERVKQRRSSILLMESRKNMTMRFRSRKKGARENAAMPRRILSSVISNNLLPLKRTSLY